jgi:hypothetical protein
MNNELYFLSWNKGTSDLDCMDKAANRYGFKYHLWDYWSKNYPSTYIPYPDVESFIDFEIKSRVEKAFEQKSLAFIKLKNTTGSRFAIINPNIQYLPAEDPQVFGKRTYQKFKYMANNGRSGETTKNERGMKGKLVAVSSVEEFLDQKQIFEKWKQKVLSGDQKYQKIVGKPIPEPKTNS